MSDRTTTIDEHDPAAGKILRVLEEFIDEVGARECTAHFDNVVDGKNYLKGKHLIQKPERFIEDHLVFPILRRVFEYSLRPRPKQYAPRWPRKSGIPDFAITSLPIETAMQNDLRVFGEVKPPKKIENAQRDVKEYLDSDLDIHAVVFLSDGFEWQLWVRPKGVPVDKLDNPYAAASLRDSLRTVRTRNMTTASYQLTETRNNIDTDAFADFSKESIIDVIETEFGLSISSIR